MRIAIIIVLVAVVLCSIGDARAQMTIDITQPGTYVAYSQGASPYRIVIANLESPNNIWNLGIGTWDSFPAVCDTRLAYGLSGNIRIRDLTDSTDTVVAQGAYPRWLPGCERISYQRTDGIMKIWTNNTDGNDETLLVDGASPSWYTNDKFAYHYIWRIWVYDNGDITQISDDIPVNYPSISPNGERVVYNFGSSIWLHENGSNREILDNGGNYPNWIGDDTLIWSDYTKLWTGDIGASGMENITEIGSGGYGIFAWTVPEPEPEPEDPPPSTDSTYLAEIAHNVRLLTSQQMLTNWVVIGTLVLILLRKK